jgi:hypothetical protein
MRTKNSMKLTSYRLGLEKIPGMGMAQGAEN